MLQRVLTAYSLAFRLPVAPICCCYCFLCLCSVTVSASASVLCCCGGHYFLYLIALLSAAVFCYICCNMHERTTIMYFDQAWPGTGTTHSTSPQLKLKLVSFLGCTFSKGCMEKGGGGRQAVWQAVGPSNDLYFNKRAQDMQRN